MRNTGLFTALLLLCLGQAAHGQSVLDESVTLEYTGERLELVLKDITVAYGIRFAYSNEYVPADRFVDIYLVDVPLRQALDTLFVNTAIVYKSVGSTVILKEDKAKARELELLSSVTPVRPVPLQDQRMAEERLRLSTRLPDLGHTGHKELPGGDRFEEFDLEKYLIAALEAAEEEEEPAIEIPDDHELMQVSILPFLGTNAHRSHEVTNNFSLNVFWGANGGVDGVEVGGMVNSIAKDVKGVQIAGFGNAVGGGMTGTQVGGLFNANRGFTQGVQVAGLFNSTRHTDAVQIAGLFNLAAQDAAGAQVAGLFNAGAGKAGVQMAALFNTSGDTTRTQVSTLFNAAGHLRGSQISLLNMARNVEGFQLGLINVADTVSGFSLGLLNFVKRGYNRFELSSSEILHANAAFKFGTKGLYSILHAGSRWNKRRRTQGEQSQSGVFMSWGLGYGIGTVATFSERSHLNIETVAIHVNEMKKWTRELNLLTQLRLTIDRRLGKQTSFFAGPVGNLMVSKLQDQDTGNIGSSIVPYAFYDETRGDTNIKMWVGFQSGFRF